MNEAPPSLFLSYARGDDELFVKRLYHDLTARGFEIWFDRVSLPSRQLTFHQEIKDTIRTRIDRLVYIAGPQAAISDYVREEWQFALEIDKAVIPILRKGGYGVVPGGLSLLHCDDFRDDTQYPAQLAKLVENLNRPEPRLGALRGVPSLPPHFFGRPELLHRLKDTLLVDLQTPVVITGPEARVGIHGMGGIGKSVLAAALARDREIRRAYPDGVIWISVGQEPNLPLLQRNVAQQLGSRESFETKVQGQGVLKALLEQKAVLLVLDDVWNAGDASAFDVLGPRCRSLITTRDTGILHTLHSETMPVSLFTEEEALQLLADTAGTEPPALPPEAREVIRECGCLPLAVALCGGMARKRGGVWSGILQRLRRADLEKIADREAINPQHQNIWRAMQASVDVLAPDEQKCFVDLAVFAIDRTVPEAAVAALWAHTGQLDALDTEDLLINLGERSLIRLDHAAQTGESVARRISLHDLLHDFAMRQAGEPGPLHRNLLDAYRKKCTDGWPTGPNDGYYFQELSRHLLAAGAVEEATRLLVDYRWMAAKLSTCGVEALIGDYKRLVPDRTSPLGLVEGALRLSSHVLAVRPEELPSQLLGRMLDLEASDIRKVLDEACVQAPKPWLVPISRSLESPAGPLLRTLAGHSRPVSDVVLSPDGATVVSGSSDGTLRGWELVSGRTRVTLRHRGGVEHVAMSSDGRTVVSGGWQALNVWDLASGRLVKTLEAVGAHVRAVAVGLDGRTVVSGSEEGSIKIWDLASGHLLSTSEGLNGIENLAITSDGRTVVSASRNSSSMQIWDLPSGRLIVTLVSKFGAFAGSVKPEDKPVFPTEARPYENFCFKGISADGSTIITGEDDGTLQVWSFTSSQLRLLNTLTGHKDSVHHVAIDGDGRIAVSGSSDETLRVWDLATGRQCAVLEGHHHAVWKVAISADGHTAVSAAEDHTVKVWDLALVLASRPVGPDQTAPLIGGLKPRGRERSGRIDILALSGKTVISVTNNWHAGWGRMDVWDFDTGRLLLTFPKHQAGIRDMAMSPNGRTVVSASYDKTLKVSELVSGRVLVTLVGHQDAVACVAVSPNGYLAVSGSLDKTLVVWDLASGKLLRTLEGHQGWVSDLAISPDGRTVVSASADKTVRIWDLVSGKLQHTLKGHDEQIYALAISPDGRTAVSGSSDGILHVWELVSGRLLTTLVGHRGWGHEDTVSSTPVVAFSADGCSVISGSGDRTLRVWDLASGRLLRTFEGFENEVAAIAMRADNHTGVTGPSDRTVRVWDLASGRLVASFTADVILSAIALSSDDRIVASDALGRLHFLQLLVPGSSAGRGQ